MAILGLAVLATRGQVVGYTPVLAVEPTPGLGEVHTLALVVEPTPGLVGVHTLALVVEPTPGLVGVHIQGQAAGHTQGLVAVPTPVRVALVMLAQVVEILTAGIVHRHIASDNQRCGWLWTSESAWSGGRVTPDQITALIRDVTDLLAHSDGEREVIDAALRSVFSAMQRVAPDDRAELQGLVDAFLADPDDKDAFTGLSALLQRARLPDH